MGAPKNQKRKYETPKKPYDRVRLDRERKIRQDFGLRRKKEIWKAEALLRNFRQRARGLQAKSDEEKEKMLFDKLSKMGIKCSRLEDILEIGLEDILARRLQTLVHKKGIAGTPMQARQFIVHGHVLVAGRKVLWPSYIVEAGEENTVTLEPKMVTAIVKQGSEKK